MYKKTRLIAELNFFCLFYFRLRLFDTSWQLSIADKFIDNQKTEDFSDR